MNRSKSSILIIRLVIAWVGVGWLIGQNGVETFWSDFLVGMLHDYIHLGKFIKLDI